MTRVVLFTGPSGAGKTTVAEAWAESRSTATGVFDHDHARFIVRAGYVSRSAAHKDPALRAEADRQWLLAAEVCEAIARAYTARGCDLAISAFRPPGEWMGCWAELDAMDPCIVALLPRPEVLFARDGERSGRMKVGEDTIRRSLVYDWAAWQAHPRAVVIDNSDLSVAQTVDRVNELIDRI